MLDCSGDACENANDKHLSYEVRFAGAGAAYQDQKAFQVKKQRYKLLIEQMDDLSQIPFDCLLRQFFREFRLLSNDFT
jgi:hypothetical protein